MKASGTVLVLAATFGLALKGIWARLAYAEGLDVPAVLFYRSALAAPLVVASTLWLLKKERRTHSTELAAVDSPGSALQPAHYIRGALWGVFFAVGMFFDFSAIAHLGAGVSRVILFGYPLLVLVLEGALDKSWPERSRLVGFGAAWLGLACVASNGFFSQATRETWEWGWGLLSMTFYAVYVYFTGKLSKRMGSVRLTGASNLATSFVVVTFLLIVGGGAAPVVPAWGLFWVFVMVVVSTVAPYFMFMEGIRRLGSGEASLLSMSGPIVTLVVGYLVLGERLSPLQVVGTALTLLGVAVATGKLRVGRVAPPTGRRAEASMQTAHLPRTHPPR